MHGGRVGMLLAMMSTTCPKLEHSLFTKPNELVNELVALEYPDSVLMDQEMLRDRNLGASAIIRPL